MSKKLNNQFSSSRMMLSEHREQLIKRHYEVQRQEQYPRPNFTQQQLEEFEILTANSLKHQLPLTITYIGDDGTYSEATGLVKRRDSVTKYISLVTAGKTISISWRDIVRIELP
ncbi:MAG: YolD-like family protein [Bacillota bacterium]|nr:YolD-like family protein [Bacillota bacterium]